MKPRNITSLLLLTLLCLGGCMTPPKQEAQKAGDDEYVTLPPKTGSHMPRRVKKSDLAAGKVPDAGDAQEVNKDQFIGSIRPGVKLDSGR